MKTTSSGILILDAQGEVLLCHATGTPIWDIPKGGIDAGESERQAALRETSEETGLLFAADDLLELGRFAYRPSKDLHLFAVLVERFDSGRCVCRSRFRDWRGRMQPEMDGFEWTPFARVPARCARNMTALLTGVVVLPRLLERLVEAGRVVTPSMAGPEN